jgi:hypothetical protein
VADVYNGDVRLKGSALAVALALVGAVVALTGCGVSKTIDPVAAAATKTENTGATKMSMIVAVEAPGASSPATITANGVVDQNAADVNIDASSLVGQSGLSVPAGSSGNVEVRYLVENGDPVVYVNLPFLSNLLPGGKTWVRLDLQKAGNVLGVDVNQLLGQAGQNPAQVLDMLRASGSVDTVGPDTIDGVATTHYRASVDLQKLAGQQGPLGQQLADRLAAAGVSVQLPVEVWIGNDDGLVHQLTFSEHGQHDGQNVGVDLTLKMSDYGSAVDVQAPPADQVFDATDLASTLGNAIH